MRELGPEDQLATLRMRQVKLSGILAFSVRVEIFVLTIQNGNKFSS